MNAIILCGGLSTRLGDITKSIPKVLLDIKGKTVLAWQIEKLKKLGVTEVVLAAGHLSDVLFEKVGLHIDGVTITYAIEQERLGTGGAIKHAWEYLTNQDAPTVILNGDVLTPVSLVKMAKELKPESDGIMLAAKVEDASTYETLKYDSEKHLQEFIKRDGLKNPGYINAGIYIFTQHVKKYFPEQKSFSIEYDVFPRMTNLYVYESQEPWIDIGVPERLAWAQEHWKIER